VSTINIAVSERNAMQQKAKQQHMASASTGRVHAGTKPESSLSMWLISTRGREGLN